MGVKKSPSICEKGPKVAAAAAKWARTRAIVCCSVQFYAGTPVATIGRSDRRYAMAADTGPLLKEAPLLTP